MMFVPGPINIVSPLAAPMQSIVDSSTNSPSSDFVGALHLTGDFVADQLSLHPGLSTWLLIIPFLIVILAITFNIKVGEWAKEEEHRLMENGIKRLKKRGLKPWNSEASWDSDLEKAMGLAKLAELEDYRELEEKCWVDKEIKIIIGRDSPAVA
ncbi:hypothetical protein BCR34DRAFT_177881 [Clohesyomyces aquaticus]|uniref:Uncharacterized protein n=1 Tax=Clohesyomyces aquaticus TaxID=1231657 RepID=A0A1Y1ZZE0_9PLEO|nr:hypothetical protein BCR34DRAFT_177881 [Clohesyomyces aquaticus]